MPRPHPLPRRPRKGARQYSAKGTAASKPELIATKAARRPKTTALQLRREAKALLSKPGKKVDTVVRLRELRK